MKYRCSKCFRPMSGEENTPAQCACGGWIESAPKPRKSKPAPDWLGCGRKITSESWNGFLKARAEHFLAIDAKGGA
jgi:DNA-directed RNA polymerase subunit RPC12/RpoP